MILLCIVIPYLTEEIIMKKTAHVFYTVGKWLQLVAVILLALGIVGCGIAIAVYAVQANEEGVIYWVARAIVCFVYLLVEIAIWIVVGVAIRKQKEDSKSKAPHIMCIVAGAIGNICYLVGGILSLILVIRGEDAGEIQAISKEQVKDVVAKDKEEKPVEETKEEK